MKNIVLTLLLAINLNVFFACSCNRGMIDLPLAEMGLLQTKTSGIYNSGDLIFIGKLLSISATIETKDGGFRDFTFKIEKIYKGAYPDTIKIRTRSTSDACGFGALPATDCLIFTSKARDGLYYTYRSDCCKSISKAFEEKRYLKFITFLDAITEGIDGDYSFFQPHAIQHAKIKNLPDSLEVVRFSIKNGQLNDLWKIMDNYGTILEEGHYQDGKRHGKWMIHSFREIENDNYGDLRLETETTKYQLGKIKSRILVSIDQQLNWETTNYKTVRIQTFKNGKLISDEIPKEGNPTLGLPSSKNSAKS